MTFDDFFTNNENENDDSNEMDELFSKLISLIKDMEEHNNGVENTIFDSTPEKVEKIMLDGVLYEKRTWVDNDVQFIKMTIINEDEVKTLEEQLQDAIDIENYEEAARLRDLINNKI
jgi:excinuclease UvrABC helicase subunit UvrB